MNVFVKGKETLLFLCFLSQPFTPGKPWDTLGNKPRTLGNVENFHYKLDQSFPHM